MDCGTYVVAFLVFTIVIVLLVIIALDGSRESWRESFGVPTSSQPLYIVYSISNSPYQEWQADLLDYSIKKVGQPGTVIRLVSQDPKYPNRKVPRSKIGMTVETEDFSKYSDGYSPTNKPGSLVTLFKKHKLPPQAVAILCDPDMIFTKRWDPRPETPMGTVYGQRWKGYGKSYCSRTTSYSEDCPKDESEAIMYPFAMTVRDLGRILPRYYASSREYPKYRDWMVEMTALVVAQNDPKMGLKIVTVPNIGLCNDWDNHNDEEAPLVHYCQSIKNKNGEEIWSKRRYRAWDPVPEPKMALNRVDRVVLSTIGEYLRETTHVS